MSYYMEHSGRRRPLLAAIAAGLLVVIAWTRNLDDRLPHDFLRERDDRRQLFTILSSGDADFADPSKNVALLRTDAEDEIPTARDRSRCQIVYLLGVEGAMHHGFTPVLEALAREQIDPESGERYVVSTSKYMVRAALYGWYSPMWFRKLGFDGRTQPDIDDPKLVRNVVRTGCPDDGRRHVLLEWQSFPSGHTDDKRNYRVHRQQDWATMTAEEVADDPRAMSQPTDLTKFVKAYGPYAEIKFVVLHRPFLETIASHPSWDGGVEGHSNVIRGFMLILGRFLNAHRLDAVDGSRLWSLVCTDQITRKSYNSQEELNDARSEIVSGLTEFLGWPNKDCPECFGSWRDSRKQPELVMGSANVEMLREHTRLLEGVWPPATSKEKGGYEPQCSI